jgi:radical SAM-linked protein
MRLRVRFSEQGKIRFVSHRDVARIWERALRRVELPVVYSGGFSPRPRLHFGLALSVGHESHAEYVDIDVVAPLDEAEVAALPARLSAVVPSGITCTASGIVEPTDKRSLQDSVTSSTWLIGVEGAAPTAAEDAVAALLAAPTLVTTRERKGREVSDDIRPYVRSLHVDADASDRQRGIALRAEIGTQPRALRPAELIAALGPPWRERHVCRLAQWIDHDGLRREPLPLPHDAASWTRTEACAT